MEKIKVLCKNTNEYYEVEPGTTLMQLMKQLDKKDMESNFLMAYVDNMLKELSYHIYIPHTILFLDKSHPDTQRSYLRTLSFIAQKAASELFEKYSLILDYTLPNGLYGELRRKSANNGDGTPKEVQMSLADVVQLKKRMREIVEADFPLVKLKLPNKDAAAIFRKNGREQKALLTEVVGHFYVSTYLLDGYIDTFYGPLLYSTGKAKVFDVIPYHYGFCIQTSSVLDPNKISNFKYQDKLSAVFRENADWCAKTGASTLGSVNALIRAGKAKDIILISEALHERKFADIADMIYSKRNKLRLVLIAGPSSSGKTTTSKRIALQCKVLGLNPIVIAMDNYFVSRDKTPLDENGEYNFENLHALDLELLNNQLNDLFDGKEINVPTYDFIKGDRIFDGKMIHMEENDIIIMEGIHALNPELLPDVSKNKVFKIYASALTSLSIDENNSISTSDNRKLRRMTRDYATRGISPEETILRWPSVRRGEEKNIFPFQENADVMFNSTLIYELPMLKYYVEPLLHTISPTSDAYPESLRLLKFLSYIVGLSQSDTIHIPPTSVMREFIGGSSFNY